MDTATLLSQGLPALSLTFALYFALKFLNIISYGPKRPVITVPVPKEAHPEWKPVASGTTKSSQDSFIECFDPSTGAYLGSVRKCLPAELEDRVQRARLAQHQFILTSSFQQRRQFLQDMIQFVLENQQTIANVCSRDSGKTFVDAFFGEILTTLEKARWVAQNGEQVLQTEYRSVGMLTMHKQARVEYHPLGVVAAIVSWNYPFHNSFGPIISAVFAGNAILIKASEHVAWSAVNYFEPLIHRLLEANGFPKDLVQFIIGDGEVGSALINSGVDKVTFIGSPGVGQKVMETAAKTLTPVVLELGGKDAAVICEDADLNQVVPIVMRGTFQNVGQNCIGLERIVLHERIYEEFISRVVPLVQKLRQGPPMGEQEVDCGAMTMGKQLQHIQSLVDDAVSKGARLLCGGEVFKSGNGQFYKPTVLADVGPNMKIANEEVFGPVMVIMKFSTDREAVDLVNSSPFGLGGSVFSQNTYRAEIIGRLIKTGMCNINDFAVNYLCQSLPFGGVKRSGFGRFAGVEGLRGECVVKCVTVDRVPFVKTTIPPLLDYPLDREKSTALCKELARTVYGQTWGEKVSAVVKLVRVAVFGGVSK